MKLLHTSDWHLGHTLYNYDRMEEQTDMLRQIVEIVRQQKPDLFLLSGDVYHTAQPSAAVQTLFAETMVQLHDAHPAMTIVVTAGNHDSGAKHEIFKTPWRALKVHTIGNLEKDDPEQHIIEVPDVGFVIAIPYVHERNLPEGFFQQVQDLVEARNPKGLPVVMMAHTTVQGCDYTGHDDTYQDEAEQYRVGGIDAIPLDEMGSGYDYLALGHIHHEQFARSERNNVKYSGSPLAVSFDEHYVHSVSLVTIERRGSMPHIETCEVHNIRPLVTLPTSGRTSWEEAKALLEHFPADIPAYIRLNVEIEDYLPTEANNEAQALTQEKQCRFCFINAKRRERESTETQDMTIQEFQAEEPIHIAQLYAEQRGGTFDDEMKQLFEEVAELLKSEK
ncbi:MAG: exonuclease SbcCD subunit D [Bacteroidales bacterium]|nr:exonuclease SbcCD subunit D [Bacteroidales bacterium]